MDIRQEMCDDIMFQSINGVLTNPFGMKRAFSGYSCGRGVGLDYFDGEHAFAIRGIFAVDGVRSEWSLSASQFEGVVYTGNHKQEAFTAKRIGPAGN